MQKKETKSIFINTVDEMLFKKLVSFEDTHSSNEYLNFDIFLNICYEKYKENREDFVNYYNKNGECIMENKIETLKKLAEDEVITRRQNTKYDTTNELFSILNRIKGYEVGLKAPGTGRLILKDGDKTYVLELHDVEANCKSVSEAIDIFL